MICGLKYEMFAMASNSRLLCTDIFEMHLGGFPGGRRARSGGASHTATPANGRTACRRCGRS